MVPCFVVLQTMISETFLLWVLTATAECFPGGPFLPLNIPRKSSLPLPFWRDGEPSWEYQWRPFERKVGPQGSRNARQPKPRSLSKYQLEHFSDEKAEEFSFAQPTYFESPGSLERLNSQPWLLPDEDSHYWRPPRSIADYDSNIFPYGNILGNIGRTIQPKRAFSLNYLMYLIPHLIQKMDSSEDLRPQRTLDSSEETSDQCLWKRLEHRSQSWICSHYSSGEMGAILFSELCESDKQVLRTTATDIFQEVIQKCCVVGSGTINSCPANSRDRNLLVLAMYLLTMN